MNYNETYKLLIAKGKLRSLDKSKPPVYTEQHHIVPRCLGGGDEQSNLVYLTAREHFVAHRLLCKMHPKSYKLKLALSVFSMGKDRRKLTSKQYEIAKEAASQANKELHRLGKHPSQKPEVQAKFWANCRARLAQLALEGKRWSQTAAGKAKLAESIRAQQAIEHTCRYCLLKGKGSNMPRYHFDNCLFSDINIKATLAEEHYRLSIKAGKVCPACFKVVSGGNFTRWHGDKCKLAK